MQEPDVARKQGVLTNRRPDAIYQGNTDSINAGGVTEWLKVAVLKTAVPKGTGGSNPSSSVKETAHL